MRRLSQAFAFRTPRQGSFARRDFSWAFFRSTAGPFSITLAELGSPAGLAGGDEQLFVVVDFDDPAPGSFGAAIP